MATKTINQKITISGGDEIARTLRDLARLGEQAFAQLADAAKKIDLNLPVDKVKQQLVELGQSGQQAFGQLAQAAERSVSSVKEVGTQSTQASQGVAQVGTAAQKTSQDVAAIGPAAQQGLGAVQQQATAAATAITSIGTAVKVVGATLAGLAATFTGLVAAATAMGKSASDAVISIGRSADAAKVSVENFSRANLLLQQFGLTADQSAAAIKRLGEAGKAAFDSAVQSMQRLSSAGGETTTALQRALQGTEQTLDRIARTGGTAAAKFAQGAKVIVNEVALQNEQTRAKFAAQMASMADITVNGKRLFDEGTAAILKYAGAFNEVTGAARRPTEMLTELASRLEKIPSAAERARVLTAIFQELGPVMGKALERGTAAFVNMIGTIDRLNLKTTEAERKVGQDFRAAWDLLQAVIAKNNQEIGLLIAKPLTPFINKFAEAMRRSSDTFKIYEAAVNAVMPVIGKFLDEIAKIGKVDATFPETLKKGVEEFGNAIGAIFTNVIIPAFNGLKKIATDVAEALTTLFGSKVTPTMVALGAAVTVLLGPINALGVALLAIFGSGAGGGSPSAGVVRLQENLKALGIDLTAIRQSFVGFGQQIPGIISTVGAAFNGLRSVLQTVAGLINTALGREVVTEAGIAVVLAVATMTDAFRGLASVMVTLAAGLSIVNTAMLILARSPVAVAATILILATNFERLSSVLEPVARLLNALTGINIFTGEGLSIALVAGLTAAFIRLAFGVGLVTTALFALANTPAIAALLTLAAIIRDLNRRDPFAAQDKAMKELIDSYNKGLISLEKFKEEEAKLIAARKGLTAAPDISSTWERMKAEAEKAINDLLGTSDKAATTVGNQWKTAAQKVTDGFREIRPGVWEKIVTDAKQAGEKVTQDATATVNKVDATYRQIRPGVFERIVTESKTAAQQIEQPIIETVKKIEQQLQTTKERVDQTFQSFDAGRAFGGMGQLEEGLKRIAAEAAAAKEKVDALTTQPPAAQAAPLLSQQISDSIDQVKDVIADQADEIQDALTDPYEQALREINEILDNIKTEVTDTFRRFDEGPEFEGTVEDRRDQPIPSGRFEETMVEQFQFALDSMESASREAWDFISEHIEHTINGITPMFTHLANEFQRIVVDFISKGDNPFDILREQASVAVLGVKAALAGITEAMVAPFRAALDQIGPQIAAALAQVALADPFQPLVQQAQNAVNFIVATFQQLGQQIAAALATIAVDPFQPLVLQAQAAVTAIVETFAQLGTALIAPFEALRAGVDAMLQGIGQLVTATFESINAGVASAASAVNSAIAQIISALQAAVAEAQALAAAAQRAAAEASAARAAGGFARGGYTGDVGVRRVAGVVHGGEYVEPAHVVRQPGVRAFLETLRRVGNLREALRRFSKGFSVGGFVDDLAGRMSGALVPGYASGGLVTQPVGKTAPRNLGVLRLEAGGERFEVMADDTTAFKLQRFARRQLMTSGGRAPVWER